MSLGKPTMGYVRALTARPKRLRRGPRKAPLANADGLPEP